MHEQPLASAADALQHTWRLPWQIADLTPDRAEAEFAIVGEDGALFRDSSRWAYALCAHAPGRARAEVLAPDREAAAAVRSACGSGCGAGAAQLWRIDRGSGRAATWSAPRAIAPRSEPAGPVAVLCDLGRVLVDFDHDLFLRHFELVVGHPPDRETYARLMSLLPQVERGALPPEELFERSYLDLQLSRLDRKMFRRLWCSILFPRPAGATWMRRLAQRPKVALTVVTNIDPWRLNWIKERLGLDDLCRYAVASFEDGVNPKHEDATMWLRALGFCTLRLKAEPATVIVLDDVPENLATARAAGVGTHHVQVLHPAQMWSELGEAGLYLPLAGR
jgi:FMN phosphatase YigB (HAD superfamily)